MTSQRLSDKATTLWEDIQGPFRVVPKFFSYTVYFQFTEVKLQLPLLLIWANTHGSLWCRTWVPLAGMTNKPPCLLTYCWSSETVGHLWPLGVTAFGRRHRALRKTEDTHLAIQVSSSPGGQWVTGADVRCPWQRSSFFFFKASAHLVKLLGGGGFKATEIGRTLHVKEAARTQVLWREGAEFAGRTRGRPGLWMRRVR